MAATDIQQSLSVGQSENTTIDGVIRPHLRLEPCETLKKERHSNSVLPLAVKKGPMLTKRSSNQHVGNKRKYTHPTIHQNIVESDNKRRPIAVTRNAIKYADPPLPGTPDPNSEAKSVTIWRIQNSLEEWNTHLKDIMDKKERDDVIVQTEIEKRDTDVQELKNKYSAETKLRMKAERKRDNFAERLKNAEEELDQHKEQLEQFHNQLAEYELAYEQLDSKKLQLEEELQAAADQIQQSETMRRRLNDHVTELQGQLAIEEQRSKFCTIQ